VGAVVQLKTVSRQLGRPLYSQILQQLYDQIESGALPEGGTLPTELALQHRFRVSRTTVRQALAELANAGLITRHPGRGTFVSARKIADERPRRLLGFVEELRARGIPVSAETWDIGVEPAAPRLARRLDLPAGAPITRVRHRTSVEGRPIGISRVHLRCGCHLDRTTMDAAPGFFTFLRHHYREMHGLQFSHARRSMSASVGTASDTRELACTRRAPLLLVELQIFADERPVIYIEALYRGDRYQYQELLDV
jgi:GntR family transcriptional regulator